MDNLKFYHNEIPDFLIRLADTPPVQRLKHVGMNCGCEYTSFSRFSSLSYYSRFEHSLGTGLITWHFTGDIAASSAALLHDVATPVFAHTVDFLNGDYLTQESTESRTSAIISSSPELMGTLRDLGLSVSDVEDYHRYPIADNDSPKLSADRLEYSLGNMVNYGLTDGETANRLYSDLTVCSNEENEDELAFISLSGAETFAANALKCSKIYVSPEDRYSMQILSELLKLAVSVKALCQDDLYCDEPAVIETLMKNSTTAKKWNEFRSLSKMVPAEAYPDFARVIPAKKRRIDPLVAGEGRLSSISEPFRKELEDFLSESQAFPIAAI